MADVTTPLIVNRRQTTTIPFCEVIAQLLRTGLRSNEEDPPAESEDGCYASLIIFIVICSLGSVMIISCMMTSDHITYGVVSIFLIVLILFAMGTMLYFIKMKNKWLDVSHGVVLCTSDTPSRSNTNHFTVNEQCDVVGSSLSASRQRHQTSRLSLVGVYIFGSTSLIMYFVDIIQVTTCMPFYFNEYDKHRYAYEDMLYVVFRIIANALLCVQIAFFSCFKHVKFVSTPKFCYSLLLFVSINFLFLLESLMYAGYVRLDVALPWQSRHAPDHLSGKYDLHCFNGTRVFDKSVLLMNDLVYPFAIEFYILSIGIFLHHWFNLVPTTSRPTRTAILRPDAFDEINSDSSTDRQHNCSSALPLAVFMSLLMIGSAAFLLFQNIVGVVIYIYHTIRVIFQSLLTVPVLLGVRYLSYFRYDRKPSLDGSDMLLVSTVTSTFLVTGFTAVTSSTLLHKFAASDDFDREVTPDFDVTISDSLICLIYAIVNYIQITIQTCFFISARRRVPPRCESITSYRLRECFLYIAVCNAFILATDTFIALHTFRVESPTNVWFFGARHWSILESVLFPVAELYHFHSVLLCSELYLNFKVD